MRFPLLDKNDSWKIIINKLREESTEATVEMRNQTFGKYEDNKENIAAEVLDVIQVCIGALDKLEQEGLDLILASEKHCNKLKNRNWRIKEYLNLSESKVCPKCAEKRLFEVIGQVVNDD